MDPKGMGKTAIGDKNEGNVGGESHGIHAWECDVLENRTSEICLH